MFVWLHVNSAALKERVAAFGRVVLQRPRSRGCSVWTRCRGVPEARNQQLQRPRSLQQGCNGRMRNGQEAASRSIAGACGGRGGKVSSGGKELVAGNSLLGVL